MKLDNLDRKILHELDSDAMLPLSKVAKRLRIGSDLVEYRLDKFLDEGIVQRFTPFINPSALGFGIYKTYLRHRLPKKQLQSFVDRINAHERLHWFIQGYGRWDLMFSLNAKSFAEYQMLYDELVGTLGEHIVDQAVYALVSAHRFPKHYLVGKGNGAVQWHGNETVASVDEFERLLLEQLSVNARASDVELARALKTTPAVVRYRREKLERNRVIVGYRMQLDYELLGMTVAKVFLELKDYSPSVRERVLQFCRREPRVTCFVQQIGNYPLEFEVEMETYSQFSELLERLREEFSSAVSRFDHMIITRDHFHRIPSRKTRITAYE